MTVNTALAKKMRWLYSTDRGRALREASGMTTESLTILCKEDDLVVNVLRRARVGAPPCLIVFEAESSGDLEVRMFLVGTAKKPTDTATEAFRHTSTIGMLYLTSLHSGASHFRLNEWDREQVATPAPSRQLQESI